MSGGVLRNPLTSAQVKSDFHSDFVTAAEFLQSTCNELPTQVTAITCIVTMQCPNCSIIYLCHLLMHFLLVGSNSRTGQSVEKTIFKWNVQ